jgi:hypothetical protein
MFQTALAADERSVAAIKARLAAADRKLEAAVDAITVGRTAASSR